MGCDDACILAAMIYIDRVMASTTDCIVNQQSIHRYLAASLLVSVKFHDDTFYSNSYYAFGAGVSLQELNALEARFLDLIKWKVNITPEEYFCYQQRFSKSA